jgi:hypothetical protein
LALNAGLEKTKGLIRVHYPENQASAKDYDFYRYIFTTTLTLAAKPLHKPMWHLPPSVLSVH